MEGDEGEDAEPEVDPKTKAIQGWFYLSWRSSAQRSRTNAAMRFM